MPRLSADQWAAVRLEWEGEPTASFLGLAGKHGLQASSISRRAASEGWTKRGVIGDINEAAQRKADARFRDEKQFQELMFRGIRTVARVYGLPEILKCSREHRLERVIPDFVLFHVDGTVSVVECKQAGLRLSSYLAGIAQAKYAADLIHLSEPSRYGKTRSFLAVPSGVEKEVGYACMLFGVGYMPIGNYSEHFA